MVLGGNQMVQTGDALEAIQNFETVYQQFYAAEPQPGTPLHWEWERCRAKLDRIATGLQAAATGSKNALEVCKSLLGPEMTSTILRGNGNRLGNPAMIVLSIALATIATLGSYTANKWMAYQADIADKVSKGQLPSEYAPGPGPIGNLANVIKWAVIGLSAVIVMPTVLATMGVITEGRESRRQLRASRR